MADVIRGLVGGDSELGALKHDLKSALDKVVPTEIKTVNGAYEEPMYLGLKHKPIGVILLSCIDARDQEDPEGVLTGGFCHCTWEGVQSRVRINSIDGLTPDPTVLFRFTFWVIG